MPSGFWACEPIEVASAAGKSPSAAVNEVMTTGRIRSSDPSHTSFPDGITAFAHLIIVRDQQHSVLNRHAENRHEADRGGDAEGCAGKIEGHTPPIAASSTLIGDEHTVLH